MGEPSTTCVPSRVARRLARSTTGRRTSGGTCRSPTRLCRRSRLAFDVLLGWPCILLYFPSDISTSKPSVVPLHAEKFPPQIQHIMRSYMLPVKSDHMSNLNSVILSVCHPMSALPAY